jgi:hypothetical protein
MSVALATGIIEMITVGAKVFSEERKRYYDKKTEELLQTIADNSGGDYYVRDMEAKGQAERALMMKTETLRKEWIEDMIKV